MWLSEKNRSEPVWLITFLLEQSMGVGAGNVLGVKMIFFPNFPTFAWKTFMRQRFTYRTSVAVGTLCSPLPGCYRLENRNFRAGTWNLVPIIKLKKYARLCKNFVRSQLVQYSWAPASHVWCLVFHSHFSCCCQQGTSTHLASVNLKLLPSLKMYMLYMWHASYYFYYVYAVSSAVARVSEAPPEISRGAPHTLLSYYYELQ